MAGFPRKWRDGSKPADACGGQSISLICYPVPLPLTLYCQWELGSRTFQIPMYLQPANYFYGSVPTGIPSYPTAVAAVQCNSVGTPAHQVVLLSTVLYRADQVGFPDEGSFDAITPPGQRFPQPVSTPNAAQQLLLPPGSPQLAVFSAVAPNG